MAMFCAACLAALISYGACHIADEEGLIQSEVSIQEHEADDVAEAMPSVPEMDAEQLEFLSGHLSDLLQDREQWGMRPVPFLAKLFLNAQAHFEEATSETDLHAAESTKYTLRTAGGPGSAGQTLGASKGKFGKMMRAVVTVQAMGMQIFDQCMTRQLKGGNKLNQAAKNGTQKLLEKAQALDREISLTDPATVAQLKDLSEAVVETLRLWNAAWLEYGDVVESDSKDVADFYTKREGSWIPMGKSIAASMFGPEMVLTIRGVCKGSFESAASQVAGLPEMAPQDQIKKILGLSRIIHKTTVLSAEFINKMTVAADGEHNSTMMMAMVKASPMQRMMPKHLTDTLDIVDKKTARVMTQVQDFTRTLDSAVEQLSRTKGFHQNVDEGSDAHGDERSGAHRSAGFALAAGLALALVNFLRVE